MKYCLILLFVIPLTASAQLKASLTFGYGMYAMNDLKDLQKEHSYDNPVQLRSVSSFPAYINYEACVVYQSRRSFFGGIAIGYASTGARSDYADYSGYIRQDQLINAVSVGASIGFVRKYFNNKYIVGFDFHPALTISDLELKYSWRIGSSETVDKRNFNSLNFALQPTVSLTRTLGHIGIFVQAGYSVNFDRGKLTDVEDKDVFLTDSNGNKVKADWSGLRAGVGISYSFGK